MSYGWEMQSLSLLRPCEMMENITAGHAAVKHQPFFHNYLLCLVDRLLNYFFLVGISPGRKHRIDYNLMVAC